MPVSATGFKEKCKWKLKITTIFPGQVTELQKISDST